LLVVFLVVLGLAMMPACSKKADEEKAQAGKVAMPDKAKEIPVTAIQDPRQEKMKQLQQIQGELIAMQGATLKKYPELVKEQDELRKLIDEKIQAQMKSQKVDFQALQDLQRKLQDQSLPEKERQSLMQEFQTKAQVAKKARVDAMNDAKVKEAYQKYADHLREKMIADNPQASEKIAAFDKIQAELQQVEVKAGAAAAPKPMNP
jgi:hypothetical protein